MLINLKIASAQHSPKPVQIELSARLPDNIEHACSLDCEYQVQSYGHYYLLKLATKGDIVITCQRCLHEFNHHYSNQTTLAICDSNELAEQLMNDYECISSTNGEIDLNEVLTDELYLFVPDKHLNFEECNKEVQQFINAKEPL